MTQSELWKRVEQAREAYLFAALSENQEDFRNSESDLWHEVCEADAAYARYLSNCPNAELEEVWRAGVVARKV